MSARARQAGLTLIELMIAMAILSIAIAAAFGLGYSMINGYRESRSAVQVERAARGALSFLSSAVRAASPGVETGAIVDATPGCNTFGALSVVNADTAPDELSVIFASGRIVTSMHQAVAFDQASTTLTVVDSSELNAGDKVLVIEPGVRAHLVELAAVDPTGVLTLVQPPSACATVPAFSYAAASNPLVVRAQIARIYVDTTGVPMLMMDPDAAGPLEGEPIAEGIEDLQIVVGADLDSNGALEEAGAASNDDEWAFNYPGDGNPPDLATTPWRALRITVSARALTSTSGVADSRRPAAEDRLAATAADSYRRRGLSTTVEIRNLRGSP